MLQAKSSTGEVKHSFTQTTGSGSHKIGVSIDIFSHGKAPEPRKVTVESNRVKVLTPSNETKPTPKYQIDISAISKNIDKLAMADPLKTEGISPRDLYFKANPGLLQSPVDVTNPRQWYSSSSSKRMMKKMSKSFDESAKKTRKTKSSDVAMLRSHEAPVSGKVAAFYVNFPNITKSDKMHIEKTEKKDSESNEKLPKITKATNKLDKLIYKEKTQIQITHFTPNIEESQSAKHPRDLFGSTESLDSIGRNKAKIKPSASKHFRRSNILLPKMKGRIKTTNETDAVPTCPSALDREITKSMEDILRVVTASDNVQRALRQPPNASIKLPHLAKPENNEKPSQLTINFPEPSRQTSSVANWETGVGMRKTYSYQSLNDYSQPLYKYQEEEMSTRLVKASSQESLVQSRDKFKKLRIPQQKSTVEEMKFFRNNYNLRQKSVLKLNLRTGFDPDKVPMNKVHVSSQSQDEYDDVPSKLAPYIESEPQRFVVAPDVKGQINAVQLSPDGKPTLGINSEITPCPGTSFSQLPNDDSSEVYTLKSHRSGDESSRKPKRNKSKERKKSRSRSRSKSRNKSVSRSRSRERAKSTEGYKSRKGALSRGSTVSRHSKQSRPDSKQEALKEANTVNKEGNTSDIQKDNISSKSEEYKPLPSARSPSSKKVDLHPISNHKEAKIPPPSKKVYTKSYIPPKLKKYRHTYADSLDALIRETGKESRSVLVSLALKENSIRKHRKQIIRAFDKYLLTKLGDKIMGDDTDVSLRIQDDDDLSASLPRPPAEPGKRPVFRRMKTLVPFDERGRPITRGRDKPVVNEEFPIRVYKPSIRPPSFKLDLRQYPPSYPGPLIRDITFDKRNGTIVNHGLERSMTIGEIQFPDKKTESEYNRSENGSTISQLQSIRSKHRRSKGKPKNRGNGSYMDKKLTESDMDSHFDSSMRDSDMDGSRTPADSITASMMKEIYENLNDYLEEDREQGTQYEPVIEKVHKEIMMEG